VFGVLVGRKDERRLARGRDASRRRHDLVTRRPPRTGLWAASALVILACANGCLPAGVFTTARTLEPGEIEHSLFIDVQVSRYESPAVAARPPAHERPISVETAGLQAGYALRAGVERHIELGGHLSVGAGEVNAKIALLEGDSVALALAPRFASAWGPDDRGDPQLYHARLPLLFTVEPASWLSFTPRAGLGIARGGVANYSWDNSKSLYVRDPFAEAGLTILLQLAPRVGLAVEGYALGSAGQASGRELESGGGGVAVTFGGRSAPPGGRR
jgi:hypothetical protein